MEILVHLYLFPGLGMTGAIPPVLHLTSRRVYIYTNVYTHLCQDFNTATDLEKGYRNTEKRTVMKSTVRLRSFADVKKLSNWVVVVAVRLDTAR